MTTFLLFVALIVAVGIFLAATGRFPVPRRHQTRAYRRRITARRLTLGSILGDMAGTLNVERFTDHKSETVPTYEHFGVAANTSIQKGQMVAEDASGNLVPANAATAVRVLGAANFGVDNTTPPTGFAKNSSGLSGLAGQGSARVDYGVNCWNNDTATGAITAAMIGLPCWVKDDQTVSALEGVGLPAGVICGVGDEKGGGDKQVQVQQGPVGLALAIALVLAGGSSAAEPFRARNVMTSLQAYTGTGTATLTETANGAWQVQDGVANVLNDIVFLQAGTTNIVGALDAGPWQITNLGSASTKWVLTRPSWWVNGAIMPLAQTIDIGGEGTAYLGAQFKSFAAVGSAVIGTNDPAFFIREFTQAVTLVTGFVKLGASQTFPGLKSTTTSAVEFMPTNFNGAGSTISYRTGAYASGGSATVAGALGTSTVSITALVAAGTFNTADVSTGLLTIINY